MTEHKDKAELLSEMQNGYDNFETLLSSLSEDQMTTPGVNGAWSVKDHLAHLSAWQRYVLDTMQATQQGIKLSHPWKNMSEDEINEQIYQVNKERSLADVRSESRSMYQLLRDRVSRMTTEELNQLSPSSRRSPWEHIAGNVHEHYQEHSEIIQRWLARQNTVADAR
jgi:hypothetical protein